MRKLVNICLVIMCLSVSLSLTAALGANLDSNTNLNIAAKVGQGNDNDSSSLNIRANSKLNISGVESDSDAPRGSILRVYLSNGKYAYVKILPETASLKAQEQMNAKCANNNCTVELKEVGTSNNTKVAYEVNIEEKAKVLGFIKANMNSKVYVDAETGEVISVRRPWWSFMAKAESSTEA